MTRGARAVAALATVIALLGVVILAVRGAYGAFKGGYTLVGTFDRAAYGFQQGTEVDHLGIDVGHISSVTLLPDHKVQANLKVDSGFAVPVGTKATVHNRSLFGDPYVDLVFPGSYAQGFMKQGSHIDLTSVDADTGDLIRTATPLLEAINGQDLLSLVTSLDQALTGEGPAIAQSIHDGAQLAALYSDTITAQLRALDSFSAFQAAITPTASELNTLAAQGNASLPTLNNAENDFQAALDSVNTFAAKLSSVISQERPDIDALLAKGDNLVRLLAMREPQLEQVVTGLASYFQKFATSSSAETLPNGTKFAYFKNFVEFSDISALICGLLSPPSGAGPFPAPIQGLVTTLSGTALGCKTTAGAAATARAITPKAAATDLVNRAANDIAQPQVPVHETVGDLVNHILGRT